MSVVTLKFYLDESVTPAFLAHRVAMAAARGGALRPGEAVGTPDGSVRYYVTEQPNDTLDYLERKP